MAGEVESEYWANNPGARDRVPTISRPPAAVGLDIVGGVQRELGRPNELGAATMYLLNPPGVVSIDKARTLLGYEPIVTYEEGMRRSEEWARAEGLIRSLPVVERSHSMPTPKGDGVPATRRE